MADDKPDFAKGATATKPAFDTTASGLGLAPTYLANARASATGGSGGGGTGAGTVGGRTLVTFASGSGTLTFPPPGPFTAVISVVVCPSDTARKDVVITVTGWTTAAVNLYAMDVHNVAFAGTFTVAWIASVT